jgi:hypothetical protein
MKIGKTAAELFFEQILAGETFTPKTKMIKGILLCGDRRYGRNEENEKGYTLNFHFRLKISYPQLVK